MADFYLWSVAAQHALGFKGPSFQSAYRRSQEMANLVALESCPLVPALWETVQGLGGEFTGTAKTQLDALSLGRNTRVKGWPGAPHVLSGLPDLLAPNLRRTGWVVHKSKETTQPGRQEKLWFLKGPASALSPQSTHDSGVSSTDAWPENLAERGTPIEDLLRRT